MPGTVKSGLLSDADKSYKCDSQEKVCWILNLPLDKGHFITECSISAHRNYSIFEPFFLQLLDYDNDRITFFTTVFKCNPSFNPNR